MCMRQEDYEVSGSLERCCNETYVVTPLRYVSVSNPICRSFTRFNSGFTSDISLKLFVKTKDRVRPRVTILVSSGIGVGRSEWVRRTE